MAKPKIGCSTLFTLDKQYKEMIECILDVETKYVEIVDEGDHEVTRAKVRILNELAASYDLKYMVHAPFADINIASPSKIIWDAMFERLSRSIKYAATLNCELWIFHPGVKTGISMFYPGRERVQNLQTVRLLSKFACAHSVKIAIENVPEPFPYILKSVEDFRRFYDEVDENIGLVFDVGHANINKQTDEFLTTFKERIVHLHAHDNDGKNDLHLGIGYGITDWKTVAKRLREISYDGVVIIESLDHVKDSVHKLRQLLV